MLLPRHDHVKHGLTDARRDLELHHDAPHVRKRRAPAPGELPSWMQAIASVNPGSFSALLGRGIVVFNTADWSYLGYLASFATIMLVAGTAVASRFLKAE